MRRRLLAVLAVVALAVIVSAPAGADTSIPLTDVSRIAVDSAHSHIILSSVSDAKLAVMNTNGTPDTTVTLSSPAGGMVIEGNTLYEADCLNGKIVEVNTVTLTVAGSFTASPGGECEMTYSAGRLWYQNAAGHLLSVDPTAGTPTESDSGITITAGYLASAPALTNQVVIANADGLWLYDVDSSGNATQHTHSTVTFQGVRGVAVNPNAKTAYVVTTNPAEIQTFALPALTAQTPRALPAGPLALAVSPNGAYVAAGAQASTAGSMYSYSTSSTTRTNAVTFAAGMGIFPAGVAFSPDSKSVYVAANPQGSGPVLKILKSSAVPGTLTIKRGKSPIVNGQGVTVTAHLGTSSTIKKVSIWRRLVGSTVWRLTKTGTVGKTGNLSFVAKPKYTTYYRATWPGDPTHGLTTSAAVGVAVHLVMTVTAKGGYSTQAGVRLYHYTPACSRAGHVGCPQFVAGSKPLTPGAVINAVVQGKVGGGWHTLLKGHAAAGKGGKLTLTLFYKNRSLVGVPQRIRFSIAKTAHNLGNTSAWKQFRVTN